MSIFQVGMGSCTGRLRADNYCRRKYYLECSMLYVLRFPIFQWPQNAQNAEKACNVDQTWIWIVAVLLGVGCAAFVTRKRIMISCLTDLFSEGKRGRGGGGQTVRAPL